MHVVQPPRVGLLPAYRMCPAAAVQHIPRITAQILLVIPEAESSGGPCATGVFPLGFGRQAHLVSGHPRHLLAECRCIVPGNIVYRIRVALVVAGVYPHDGPVLLLSHLVHAHVESLREFDFVLLLKVRSLDFAVGTPHHKGTRCNMDESHDHRMSTHDLLRVPNPEADDRRAGCRLRLRVRGRGIFPVNRRAGRGYRASCGGRTPSVTFEFLGLKLLRRLRPVEGLPDSHCVLAAGGDAPPVRREGDGPDITRVPPERDCLAAGCGVPDPHGPVLAARDNTFAVRREGNGPDVAGVPFECQDFLTTCDIPDQHCLVPPACGKAFTVRGESHAVDGIRHLLLHY